MKITKDKLKSLSKEEKIQLYEALQEKKRRIRKKKPQYTPHAGQLEIHQCEKRNRFTFAANGCWAKGTLLRMHDGSTIAVEDVKVGDKLMGPDGGVRNVLKLYEGKETMYQITPAQSDPHVVNASHTLSLYRWKKSRVKSELVYEEILVKDYIKQSESKKKLSYLWRPERGVNYPAQAVPISPYVFGSWLGDGTSKALAVTTMDDSTVQAFKDEWPSYQVREVRQEGNKASTYFFSNRGRNKGIQDLRELGVFGNKHIPQVYKINTRVARLELLAGIIDTDGYLDKGMYYEVIQKNEQLADDIRELAQSLGFRVSRRIKYINGVPYYRLNIAGDLHIVPTRLKYKTACKDKKKQRVYWKESFHIQKLSKDNFYGFQVDGDNLILLSDYMVNRNSGKTCLLVQEAVAAAKGYNPWLDKHTFVPAKVIVVLDRPDKVADVWIREAEKWFDISDWKKDKQGKPYVNKISLPNGSHIQFMFKEADPLAFEGIEADYVFMDEPVPRKIWVALQRAGRTKGRQARYMFIGTPIAAPWLRTDIYEPWSRGELLDVECFRFGTELNKDNLQEGFLESFSAQLTEKEKRVRLHGEFFDSDGLALADTFKRDTHIISRQQFENVFDKDRFPCVLAIDPHSSKPHHACLVGVNSDGQYFYIKELRAKEVPRKFASTLRDFMKGYRVVDIVADSSGQAEGTGGEGYKSFIDVLRDEGIQLRATSFKDKSDEDFIDRIKSVLAIPEIPDNFGMYTPKLRIVEGNKGIVTDIENVGWQKHRDIDANKPKLEIRERDFLAAFKYALASGLNVRSGREKPYRPKRAKTAYGMGKPKKFRI